MIWPGVQQPLLLVDVDGVVSLFGFPTDRPPPGALVLVDGLPHWIAKQAGSLLTRLTASFEPVWCTGWEDRAPEHLTSVLGLPSPYPHLSFGPPARDGRHWKLAAIDAHAGPDRALAWIDDGHDHRTARWARERSGRTLLITTEPAVGLTEAHARRLERWAAARR